MPRHVAEAASAISAVFSRLKHRTCEAYHPTRVGNLLKIMQTMAGALQGMLKVVPGYGFKCEPRA